MKLVVNDRHPSGVSTPADPAADFSYASPYGSSYEQPSYDTYPQQDPQYGYSPGTFNTPGAAYGDGDPLFGAMPGSVPASVPAQPNGHSGQWDTGSHQSGAYQSSGYDSGAYPNAGATAWTDQSAHGHSGAFQTGTHDTGAYPMGAYQTGTHETGAYQTSAYQTGGYRTSDYDDGQWTADQGHGPGHGPGQVPGQQEHAADQAAYDTGGHTTGTYGTDGYGTGGHGTPGYDPTVWGSGTYTAVSYGGAEHQAAAQETYESAELHGETAQQDHIPSQGRQAQQAPGQDAVQQPRTAQETEEFYEPDDHEVDPENDAPAAESKPEAATAVDAPCRSGSRGRRRSPKPRRSALLTVAVPSVCVMGVTAVAAASVTGVGEDSDDTTTQAAPDSTAVKPSAANSKLDTQLAGLSADAENFAGRASRTQERIDLKERQEAERKRKAAEAARKEALRPKFALPVAQQGLSAYYGQAGINWMSLHTGLDFPVSYGTPVMAATDGTVSTKWDVSYGNMAIVTAADGTETWYCHLSSTKIRSGSVKAGDTIAYSGNSGNSTGPHLHFEVRPGGGPAVDPLPWFRGKGLDPT